MSKSYACKAGRFVIKNIRKAGSYISDEISKLLNQEDKLRKESCDCYDTKEFENKFEPKLNRLFSDGTKLCYLSEKVGCKKSIDEKIINHEMIKQELSLIGDAFKIEYNIKVDGSISFDSYYKN